MSEPLPTLCHAKSDRSIPNRVDKDLNAIKGGGACHLREKVLAEAADTFVPHQCRGIPPLILRCQQVHYRRRLPEKLGVSWD